MGYDIVRFVEETVNRDLVVCPICQDVYESPVQLAECEHVFCSSCIKRWLKEKRECPLDRHHVGSRTCPPDRRIMVAMEKLRIRCSNISRGCKEVRPVSQIEHHQRCCKHHPRSPREYGSERRDSQEAAGSRTRNTSRQQPGHGGNNDQGFFGEENQNTGIWLAVLFIAVVLFTAVLRR